MRCYVSYLTNLTVPLQCHPSAELVCDRVHQWPLCDPDLYVDSDPREDPALGLVGLRSLRKQSQRYTKGDKRNQVCIVNTHFPIDIICYIYIFLKGCQITEPKGTLFMVYRNSLLG